MKINLETITPEHAKEILKNNKINRPLNKTRSMKLAEAIKRGEWVTNGDTIRISDTGNLLDGQHRLTAIALSEISVETFVVRGLPDEVFQSIDVGGKSRTAGDILGIKGISNCNVVAAVAKMIFLHKTYGNPFRSTAKDQPSHKQIIDLVEATPELEDYARLGSRIYTGSSKLMSASIITFCLYATSKLDDELHLSFANSVAKGVGVDDNKPALLLRNRLIENALTSKTKLATNYIVALYFKAFRAWRDGVELKTLRVSEYEKDIFNLDK